jgi:hypothetical protein
VLRGTVFEMDSWLEVWLEWWSACLVSVKPWVQVQVLSKRKKKKDMYSLLNTVGIPHWRCLAILPDTQAMSFLSLLLLPSGFSPIHSTWDFLLEY